MVLDLPQSDPELQQALQTYKPFRLLGDAGHTAECLSLAADPHWVLPCHPFHDSARRCVQVWKVFQRDMRRCCGNHDGALHADWGSLHASSNSAHLTSGSDIQAVRYGKYPDEAFRVLLLLLKDTSTCSWRLELLGACLTSGKLLTYQ